MVKQTERKEIRIEAPNWKIVSVPIIGEGSYIPNRASVEQAKIAQKIGTKGKTRKQRDLDAEYENCFYYDQDGDYAIPGAAFKKAIVTAAIDLKDLYQTTVKRNVHVLEEFCKLEYKEVHRREDLVRQAGKTRALDVRARPEFIGWKTVITVRFDADVIPEESLLNLIEQAGTKVGVGDWRPEKSGQLHGTWHIGRTNT